MNKKRNFTLLVIILIMVNLVLTISPSAAQDDSLLIWADATRAPALAPLAEQFKEEYGIPVTVQEVGMGEIRSNIAIAGPAGEGPDIIIAAHDWIGELVQNGSVVPINLGEKEQEFTEASRALFTYNGELYGMPYAAENLAFFRNPELVPDAPATWDDVMTITEELVSSGTSEYGYLIQDADAYHFFPLMSAFGGYVFGRDDNGNYDPTDVGIDSEGAIAAGSWLQTMAEAGYLIPDVNYDVLHALFESGEAAMIMTGPWALPRIRESGVPYAISNIPEGPAGPGKPFIGGQGFMISAFSENQLLAEAFLLDFMATEEAMQAMYDADPRPPAFIPLLDNLEDPDLLAFQTAGAVGEAQPSIPEMTSVWASWQGAQQFVIRGEQDAQTAYSDAATAVRTLIGGGVVVSGETETESGETVSLPGTFQDAVGCAGEWDPACEQARMALGDDDGMWSAAFELEPGDYQYKVALNGTWDVNYGAGGEQDGADIALSVSEAGFVYFVYDPTTHIVIDSVNNRIVTAPGSYQDEAGCPGDWAPDCLLSLLTDDDGDGVYTRTVEGLAAGDYAVKAAINQAWDENYGADGARDGADIAFTVAEGDSVTFSFDSTSNVLTVSAGS